MPIRRVSPLHLFLLAALAVLAGCGPDDPNPPDGPAGAVGPAIEGDRPHVVFLQPHDDPFWREFTEFMGEAASDLGYQLVVLDAGNGREAMLAQAREAVGRTPRPAALVFQNFKQNGLALLSIADEAGVPAFLVNAGVGDEAGQPREGFEHWIGEMLPGDEEAGAELARILIAEARRRGLAGADGRIHCVAIGGGVAEGASIERVRGLETAVASEPDVVLEQLVQGNWERDRARTQSRVLLERYPETAVIWLANDNMALGAIDALESVGRRPGQDVLVGGVDWSPEAMPAIRDGRMLVSMGGHFVEGGWAMVLIHDHLAGRDFADLGTRLRSNLAPITQANVDAYARLIGQEGWEDLDFRRLSRAADPDLAAYELNWGAIEKQLRDESNR